MNNFDIPTPVGFALDRLHESGFPAYVVGGCVRDHLMHRTPGDYDITTAATPEQTISVFSDCRVVETGLQHGTVTLVRDGMNIEITTYRVDGAYRDGRHPENVTFTDDLAEDLCRRDFTVNAMAYSPENGIIDLHGGMRDLEDKTISCVGSAEKRFREDGLRILRALRFAAVLDFALDAECADAVHRLSPLLSAISRERIYAELTKLLSGVAAPRILREYHDVFALLFDLGRGSLDTRPTAARLLRMRGFVEDYGTAFEIDKRAMGYALLFSEVDEGDCRRLMQSLKPSRDERSAVELLHRFGGMPETFSDEGATAPTVYAVKRLMNVGGEYFPDSVAVYKYSCGTMDETTAAEVVRIACEVRGSGACVRLAELTVSGEDMVQLGLRGAEIGRELKRLLDLVMRDVLPNEREVLLAEVGAVGREQSEKVGETL